MNISEFMACHGRSASLIGGTLLFLLIGCAGPQQITRRETRRPALPPPVLAVDEGKASYYHGKFNGRTTANGERYDKRLLTAAHRTYPFGTIVRVTRIDNGKTVLVRINDRGPYRMERSIDLSHAAAKELFMLKDGVINVKIEVLSWGEESMPAETLAFQ